MSKTLEEMTLAEVRRECAYRGLPVTGSRSDLQCILETIIVSEGNDPTTLRLPARTKNVCRLKSIDYDVSPTKDSATETAVCFSPALYTKHRNNTGGSRGERQTAAAFDDNDFGNICPIAFDSGHCCNLSSSCRNTAAVYRPSVDTIREIAHGMGGSPEQEDSRNATTTTSLALFGSKLTDLETKMSQFFWNQSNVVTRLEKVENDLHAVVSSLYRGGSTVADGFKDGPTRRHDIRNATRSPSLQGQRFGQTAVPPPPPPPPKFPASFNHAAAAIASKSQGCVENRHFDEATSDDDQSPPGTRELSIKSLDPPAADLLIFAGRKEDDPTQFVVNWECVFQESKINASDWVKAVESRLAGVARDWWNATIKESDLSWPQFKAKFSERFTGLDTHCHLRARLLTVRQSKSQRLTNFVLEKIQLARQVQTGLSEAQIVNITVGLMRTEFSTHVQLRYPMTFMELARLARILDYTLLSSQSI